MEDEKIIELYWERSETAVEETSKKYHSYCYSIAFHILDNAADAEECVNDTWLKAWYSIPPNRPNRLAIFLGKITRNLSYDVWKRYHAKKRGYGEIPLILSELNECIHAADSVETIIEEKLLTESLNRFLLGLSERKQKIFLLRYWYALPVKNISAETGIPSPVISGMLFRLRKNLKDYLEKEEIVL